MRVRIKCVANPPYTSANTTQPISYDMYMYVYSILHRRRQEEATQLQHWVQKKEIHYNYYSTKKYRVT